MRVCSTAGRPAGGAACPVFNDFVENRTHVFPVFSEFVENRAHVIPVFNEFAENRAHVVPVFDEFVENRYKPYKPTPQTAYVF